MKTDTAAVRAAYARIAPLPPDDLDRILTIAMLATGTLGMCEDIEALRASLAHESRMRQVLVDIIGDCEPCALALVERLKGMESLLTAMHETAAQERCRKVAEERSQS